MGQPTTRAVTAADIESLAGRPAAFTRFVTPLWTSAHPGLRNHDWDRDWHASAPRLGALKFVSESHTIWWQWPWPPDAGPEPGSFVTSEGLEVLRSWLGQTDRAVAPREPALHLIVARMPADPRGWAEAIAAAAGRPKLRVEVAGPATLLRWAARAPGSVVVDDLRAGWGLEARTWAHSPVEVALMAGLDHREDVHEHWLVVADELQRRGDPTGESLALALSASPDRPSRSRVLSRAYVDREAERMARAPRHVRMLAFADLHGRRFDAHDFVPDGDDGPEPGEAEVQLWTERVGPFFVRLLIRSTHAPWRGVGLPDAVLDAPELRYLSGPRLSSLTPGCADLSGRDLGRFDLSNLPAVPALPALGRSASAPTVFAYEASLRGCDLRGADLSGWQLQGADLCDARANHRTRFAHANFDHARVSAQVHAQLRGWNDNPRRHNGRRAHIREIERCPDPASDPARARS